MPPEELVPGGTERVRGAGRVTVGADPPFGVEAGDLAAPVRQREVLGRGASRAYGMRPRDVSQSLAT